MGEGFFRINMAADRQIKKARKIFTLFGTLDEIEPPSLGIISVNPEMNNLVQQAFFMDNGLFFRADQVKHVIVYFNNIIFLMHILHTPFCYTMMSLEKF